MRFLFILNVFIIIEDLSVVRCVILSQANKQKIKSAFANDGIYDAFIARLKSKRIFACLCVSVC